MRAFRFKAGVLTSLGFGHVSGLIAVVHPQAFVESIPAERREQYLATARARTIAGKRRLVAAMCGGDSLYERPEDRRLGHDGTSSDAKHQLEVDLLLSEDSRLGADNIYRAGAVDN